MSGSKERGCWRCAEEWVGGVDPGRIQAGHAEGNCQTYVGSMYVCMILMEKLPRPLKVLKYQPKWESLHGIGELPVG